MGLGRLLVAHGRVVWGEEEISRDEYHVLVDFVFVLLCLGTLSCHGTTKFSILYATPTTLKYFCDAFNLEQIHIYSTVQYTYIHTRLKEDIYLLDAKFRWQQEKKMNTLVSGRCSRCSRCSVAVGERESQHFNLAYILCLISSKLTPQPGRGTLAAQRSLEKEKRVEGKEGAKK